MIKITCIDEDYYLCSICLDVKYFLVFGAIENNSQQKSFLVWP
jgi:hypothetical protein